MINILIYIGIAVSVYITLLIIGYTISKKSVLKDPQAKLRKDLSSDFKGAYNLLRNGDLLKLKELLQKIIDKIDSDYRV